MNPSTLRCVVVEDEVESQLNLASYLSQAPGLELVGVAGSGTSAVSLVDAARPDLLLLDIRLPEMDGVEVLRRVTHRPEVVFTTAHDDYAVTAFELGALDYLVKPFGRDRLLSAIERVRARLRADREDSSAVDRALSSVGRPLKRLFARKGDRIVPIAVTDILRISASGEYAEVFAGRESFLVEVPLGELIACLDPEVFERVHRSHIVNLDAVDHLRTVDDRRLLVVFSDGSSVVASRAASERLRRRVR